MGLLHAEAAKIFRAKSHQNDSGLDKQISFHQHQREAIEAAATGASYVLTTGTGSGKSLAYIVPNVDRILRAKAANPADTRRIKAIIVYPMNALANSQMLELEKFLKYGYPEDGEPVTFARYTGQESPNDRAAILAHPPDIILTNYVMLDLVLTRPDERKHLVRAAEGLEFLVRIEECSAAIRTSLLVGSRLFGTNRRPIFAFRLHQFLSKGDTVYASLAPETERYLTDRYQLRVPEEPEKVLLPLGFCRECGQEYYVVAKSAANGTNTFVPRHDADASSGDSVNGYLYISSDHPWPTDPIVEGRVPDRRRAIGAVPA